MYMKCGIRYKDFMVRIVWLRLEADIDSTIINNSGSKMYRKLMKKKKIIIFGQTLSSGSMRLAMAAIPVIIIKTNMNFYIFAVVFCISLTS